MMTKIRPDVPPAARFNVSETARLLGISRTSVYRYVEWGLLKPMANEFIGRIAFTGKNIMDCWENFYK